MSAQQIIAIKKQIRRALQGPLFVLCQAQDPKVPIQWSGLPFDRDKETGSLRVPRFIAAAIAWGSITVLEMGPNPMFLAEGGVTFIGRTPVGKGEDENDDLMKLVADAYPYGHEATFDGVTVHIDKLEPGAYGIDGAWLTGEARIFWNIYRRS